MLEKVIIPEIKNLIAEKKFEEVKQMMLSLHPEDIASIINDLPDPCDKGFLFRMIPAATSTDVFESLTPDEQQQIMVSLSDEKLRFILNDMAVDERTELLDELPAEIFQKLINLLTPQERKIATEILGYPENSVGRLITPDYVRLSESMTAQDALEHIRNVGFGKETVYTCYIVDRDIHLIGTVSLRNLVTAETQKKMSELMMREPIRVNVHTDKEEAAHIFKKYDLLALPVVDNSEKLLGIVTFDDFVDVLEDEVTEDFEKIAAVVPVDKPYLEASLFEMVWKRSFWLIVLLTLESFSSFVLQHYSPVMQRFIALTFFIPILIGTAGNSGTQSATVIIRGLATHDIRPVDFAKVIFKESLLGLCIGGILALFGIIRAFLQQGDWWLSISVGISMGLTILLSTAVGALLPLAFRKFRLDPALMSGPLITTIVDVVGIAIYFEIGKSLLGV